MSESTNDPGTTEDSGAGLGKNSEVPEESPASESELALDKVADKLGKDTE